MSEIQEIKIKKFEKGFEIITHDKDGATFTSTNQNLENTLIWVLLRLKLMSWKNDIIRLNRRDQKRVFKMVRDHLKSAREHIKYIMTEFYEDPKQGGG